MAELLQVPPQLQPVYQDVLLGHFQFLPIQGRGILYFDSVGLSKCGPLLDPSDDPQQYGEQPDLIMKDLFLVDPMNQCQLEPPVGVHLLQHFTVLLQSGRVLRVHHVLHQVQCTGDGKELEVDVDRG